MGFISVGLWHIAGEECACKCFAESGPMENISKD